jgi:hypothetical protein
LNARLAEELTAINQYMVHAEMCENWKCKRLDEKIQKRAEEALRRSEAMLARVEKIADVGSWEGNFRSGEVSWSGFLPEPPFPPKSG